MDHKQYEVWFVTGSQNLYGQEVLREVDTHSKEIASFLDGGDVLPVDVVHRPVVTTPEEIKGVCMEADASPGCVGLIAWMHTFSPARMWIEGLKGLRKPILHLHTQYNRRIPWSGIDMDFMNLNQSAHGGREFGHIFSRLGMDRRVVAGYWRDEDVLGDLETWIRAACAWHDAQGARIARFGDNMRQVAVTEGDKVEAQIQLGYTVDGYGVGDLVEHVRSVSGQTIEELLEEYEELYRVDARLAAGGERRDALRVAARIEAGMRSFLEEGDFKGFTTTFEDLHGLDQLPGLAVQRLMADGYGFGAEGDWKTAALVRAMKVMASGMDGGTSFMEDYTYHLEPGRMQVLGAHMLEVCPSIAKPPLALEIHPLDIGGKSDPVRLVFDSAPGRAINASLIDLGHRFRILVNEVQVVEPPQPLKRLPVARVLWEPEPDLRGAAEAWILGGGAHHTGFSQVLTVEHIRNWARMAGIEMVSIDGGLDREGFRKELAWNEAFYGR